LWQSYSLMATINSRVEREAKVYPRPALSALLRFNFMRLNFAHRLCFGLLSASDYVHMQTDNNRSHPIIALIRHSALTMLHCDATPVRTSKCQKPFNTSKGLSAGMEAALICKMLSSASASSSSVSMVRSSSALNYISISMAPRENPVGRKTVLQVKLILETVYH
jgi:hypothetical protein